MGIQVGDNFDHKSKKPLDNRTQYATLAAMKAVTDANIPEGCEAYCVATDKYYKFLSSNTVDADTGKWRERQSGGGGTGDYPDLTNKPQINGFTLEGNKTGYNLNLYSTDTTVDTAIADDNKFPYYRGATFGARNITWSSIKSVLKTYFDTLYNKYVLPTATSSVLGGVKIGENMIIEDGVINPSYTIVANKFSKSDIYSTTEKVVGCWTDGRPIYQKTFTGTMLKTSNVGTEVPTTISIGASVREFIDVQGYFSNAEYGATTHMINNARYSNSAVQVVRVALDDNATSGGTTNVIRLLNSWYTSDSVYKITIRYTKATDAANSYNYANENDYSTSEKIVGTWIDGKPLYQKTIPITLPTCTTDGTEVSASFAIGASIDKAVYVNAWFNNEGKISYIYTATGASTKYVRCLVQTNAYATAADRNKIRIGSASKSTNGCTGYATIQYTKTT